MNFCLECKKTTPLPLKKLNTASARVKRYCCESCYNRITIERKRIKKNAKTVAR